MEEERYWSHLKKGDASQFMDSRNHVRACIIRHVYADGMTLRIDYLNYGAVQCDAIIHGSDIVRDEDVATQKLPSPPTSATDRSESGTNNPRRSLTAATKPPAAMSTKKAPKNLKNQIAQAVAAKIAEQHEQLTARNWPEIEATMEADDDGEVKLSFSTTVTNRPAEPGSVASKDSRIKTTLAFSLGKKSDSIDSPFPEADQLDLPGNSEPEPE